MNTNAQKLKEIIADLEAHYEATSDAQLAAYLGRQIQRLYAHLVKQEKRSDDKVPLAEYVAERRAQYQPFLDRAKEFMAAGAWQLLADELNTAFGNMPEGESVSERMEYHLANLIEAFNEAMARDDAKQAAQLALNASQLMASVGRHRALEGSSLTAKYVQERAIADGKLLNGIFQRHVFDEILRHAVVWGDELDSRMADLARMPLGPDRVLALRERNQQPCTRDEAEAEWTRQRKTWEQHGYVLREVENGFVADWEEVR